MEEFEVLSEYLLKNIIRVLALTNTCHYHRCSVYFGLLQEGRTVTKCRQGIYKCVPIKKRKRQLCIAPAFAEKVEKNGLRKWQVTFLLPGREAPEPCGEPDGIRSSSLRRSSCA